VGTLGLLHALKGVGHRAFYRWRTRASRALFSRFPERPHLLRRFRTQQDWPPGFWAAPPVRGSIDPYGSERRHPIRTGRRSPPLGRTGLANHRWSVGGKRWLVLPPGGHRGVGVGHRPGRG
jgi:hypothetical protein